MARSTRNETDLANYEVEVNGIVHTFQLDAETAKKTPGAKRVGNVDTSEPAGPARESARVRAGLPPQDPDQQVRVPTDEQREAAAKRGPSEGEFAEEQVEAAKSRGVDPATGAPEDSESGKAGAKRVQTSPRSTGRAATSKARGAQNK